MLNDSSGTYIQVIPMSEHNALAGSFTEGSDTRNTIHVPFEEPTQLSTSFTLRQAILLPWNDTAPEHLESVATLQLLLANIAVATFWLICA